MNNKINLLFIFIFVTSSLFALSSCGFKLRSAQKFPPEFKNATIQGVDEYSAVGKILKQYLGSAGLKTVPAARDADLVLVISRNDFRRRVLSVNAGGGANEYEVKYEYTMHARNKNGASLTDDINITLISNYIFDPNNVLAKSDEETVIKRRMQQQAVKQSLRQLSIRLTPSQKTQAVVPDNNTLLEKNSDTTK